MAFDLEKFNSQVYTAMTETVDQNIAAFNANSNGVLALTPSNANMGDFAIEASFKQIANLVRRRDANNGQGTITETRLQQLKSASVKVAAGTPPIVFEPSQYRWILDDPARAAAVIGDQLASAMLQDQPNTAVKALVAALTGNVAVTHTATSAANIGELTAAAAKFGDRSSAIRAWIVHSKVMNDIWQNAITNAGQLFRFGDVAILADQFGRKFIVSDVPALAPASEGGKYCTLGLTSQAALVEPNGDFEAVMIDGTGKENIQRTYQAEWSYNLGLLGYSWNTAAGGSSPNDTALGTPANWTKVATSNKDTAGVMLKSV